MSKILVIGPSWVGDMVMSQSLFKRLKEQEPEIEIDVLAPGWCKPILERMPEVRRALDMPLGHGAFDLKTRFQLVANYEAKSTIVLMFSLVRQNPPWFPSLPASPNVLVGKGKCATDY